MSWTAWYEKVKISLKKHNGKPDLPVVLLVHGLGMNNYFWVDPAKCFVLGGLAPLEIFLTQTPEKPPANAISFGFVDPSIEGLWNFLKNEGFSLASWTQRQPLGPASLVLAELETALEKIRKQWPGRPIYIIGHSRGGLIARKYLLEKNHDEVKGLATICSPHSGTGMAKFSRFLKPAGVLLDKIIPGRSRVMLAKALNRISDFFQSPAIDELQPCSDFMNSLKKPLPGKIQKLSFGGTDPALFQVVIRLPAGNFRTIRFPEMLAGLLPSERLPRELTPGLGDALVSAASARLPESIHHDFPANHVKAAYDRKIHGIIRSFLNEEE